MTPTTSPAMLVDHALEHRPLATEATPLREISPGLLMKFEMDQPGGSHKVRAARRVIQIQHMITDPVISPCRFFKRSSLSIKPLTL